MKKLSHFIIGLAILNIASSCATIVGGSSYYAKVHVPGHPFAKIEHNGVYQGNGMANFKALRSEAHVFAVVISEEGCKTQTHYFSQRRFRGWSFFGTVVGWTGFIPGTFIPLPWGIIVDAATGAWWSPDDREEGVSKQDIKHYTYLINYTGCKNKKEEKKEPEVTKALRLRNLKELQDEGILTQEEFDEEKKKILDEE